MKQCKTYVYREGRGLVDVTDIVNAPPEPRVHILADAPYQNLTVPGCEYGEKPGERARIVPIDLSSRSKYQRYMKEKGLTHASDFDSPGGFWERAAERRARIAAGTDEETNRQLKERVIESVKKVEQGYRPNPLPPVEHAEQFEVPGGIKTGDVVVA